MNIEIAGKIIELMYEKWFKDYVVGYSKPELIHETGYEENQINQAVEYLESKGLIYSNSPRRYVITAIGIDTHELTFPHATLAIKKQVRTNILEVLAELYQVSTHETMHSNVLSEKIHSSDWAYLLGTVVYLEQEGLVKLDMFQGLFFIHLTSYGLESMQKPMEDNSTLMLKAYRLLFYLENYMRKFIETQLIAKYKNDWWDKGMTLNIRNDVIEKRKKELEAGWKVSETNSGMEYLDFTDLERVIRNNWKDCFESYFHDQGKVNHRLMMLENIRNSIAHTRTLTTGSMNRFQEYYDELMNLMNFQSI